MADTQLSTYVYAPDTNKNTPAALELIATALSRMSVDIDTLLTSRIDVYLKSPAQMVNGGAVLADGNAAWGYTFAGARECWINNNINGNNLPSEKTQYTIIHEIGHMVDHDKLNNAKRATLMALMVPAGSVWTTGTYLNRPTECFADVFVRAYTDIDSVLVNYFGRQITAANYAAYITAVGGAGAPLGTTLAASSIVGATNLKLTSVTGLSVNDWISVDTGTTLEVRQLTVVGTAGAGGSGVTFVGGLTYAHSSGATVLEVAGVTDPGGTIGTGPQYSLQIKGTEFIRRVAAESIHITETGSDSVATMEFTIRTSTGQSRFGGWTNGREFPEDSVIFTDIANGRRLFGGVVTGVRRRKGAGTDIYQDVRCVSYDSWLDRRYLANYWTTNNTTSSGNKLADDKLIVQSIIQNGGAGVGLIANDTYVKSTNTNMPKMNLGDGSLRSHILTVAEQAATVADPTTRRVYVDFFKRVHYFKGSTESSTAPYRIGDAVYASVVKATSGLVSYWPMGEGPGAATAYDQQGVGNLALSGQYVRGTTAGVINDPAKTATYLAGRSYGSTTSASYHPGNVFSIELWFKRSVTGTEQMLVDAGASGEYALEFQADNTIRLLKTGTGNDFTTTATYTDLNWHHLVVTHNGSATHVYVDGVDKAGTAALKTIVASGTAFYVGQKSDNTLRFNGSLQHVAFYNAALSAATALAHYNAGVTLIPDDIYWDIDFNDSGFSVYVAGTGVSRWANVPYVSPYGANTIIDRPDVNTSAKLDAAATAFLARDFAPVQMIVFEVEGWDGWRCGQTVTFADTGLGVSGDYEIKSIETIASDSGSWVLSYRITAGAMPWRGSFDIKRKDRRKRA